MDKDACINEGMRQLNESEVYTSLEEEPTRDLVKKG